MENFTPEQGAEQMAAWNAWAGKVGPALLDFGSPFGPGTAVLDDGATSAAGGGRTGEAAPAEGAGEAVSQAPPGRPASAGHGEAAAAGWAGGEAGTDRAARKTGSPLPTSPSEAAGTNAWATRSQFCRSKPSWRCY